MTIGNGMDAFIRANWKELKSKAETLLGEKISNSDLIDMLYDDSNPVFNNDPTIQYAYGYLAGVADMLDNTLEGLLDDTDGGGQPWPI